MGRVLALDLGSKRVGVAVSDPLRITAQGLRTLPRQGGRPDRQAIAQLATENEVERIIVGWPLTLGGDEGQAAQAARRFTEDLRREIGLPIELWDERLTTAEAARVLAQAGVSRRHRRPDLDRMAATLILQSWLDAHAIGRS